MQSILVVSPSMLHTAPVMLDGRHTIPKDVIQPSQYLEFLTNQLANMTVEAWKNRQPGGVAWGLAQAVVAHNRRIVYTDGHAEMYGKTALPSFKKQLILYQF